MIAEQTNRLPGSVRKVNIQAIAGTGIGFCAVFHPERVLSPYLYQEAVFD
jgi:hypothetical protein